ncbi:MAG: DUF4349 domain-containing protein [SAR202 cluster bacterium]|nr:DUF4349 domain-containing protein [SAR202 cluster bacterium]|tara:strand:- start:1297 stop:2241 length:945 start_codon:yes stop_codon:yes gene_type:complete
MKKKDGKRTHMIPLARVQPVTVALMILLLVLAASVACAGAAELSEAGGRESAPPMGIGAPVSMDGGPAFSKEMTRASAPQSSDQIAIDVDRLIIQNVSMRLAVNSISDTIDTISSLATELGGFVVSSYVRGNGSDEYGFVSFRIPVQQTDIVRSRLRDTAVRIEEESTQSTDVTEEYVDIQGRLSNLKRTEEQYLLLFDKAKSVEDMLRIQRELSTVRSQIEQTTGRMQYLERTSAMALISVDLRLATSSDPLVPAGWSFQETVKDALRSVSLFGQWLAGAIIWVIIYSPIWGALLIATYFASRWIRRRTRNSS